MKGFGRSIWGLAIGIAIALSSCGTREGAPESSVGSESHFLTSCSATCTQGFECLCGVCTARCVETSECQEYYPSAECVIVAERPAASSCDGSEAEAFCDVRCEQDADCVGLGDDFACQAGFCRQGVVPVDTGSGRIELDELCDFYANDVCRVETDCYGYNYGSVEDCLAQQECAGWELLNRALAAGSVSFDPVATYACHQRLAEDACALPLFFYSPGLPEALQACGALTGQVPLGGSCEASVECASGPCDTSAACPGVCAAADVATPLGSLGEGEACTTVICLDLDESSETERCEQCAEGLQCYQEVCRPEWQVGDACDSLSACSPNGWCDTEQEICVRLSREGEACQPVGFDAPPCEKGLFCYAESLDTGTCVPLGGEGDRCVEDYHCPEPLRCLPNGPDTDLGTCGPPAEVGSPCNQNEDCQNGFCSENSCTEPAPGLPCVDICLNCDVPCGIDSGLTCYEGACAIDKRPGEACGEGDFCLQSTCLAGVCTARSHLGQACADNSDCLSGRCTGGVCVDSASCL